MTGSAEIPPEQHFLLEDVAAQILRLIQAGAALGKNIQIEVRGNHDPVGTEQLNALLARSRAENVRAALISLGVPAARLIAVPEDLDKETCSAVKEAGTHVLPQRIISRDLWPRSVTPMLKKKICMVGQFGVGKTSLVRRFVDSIFDERYLTTIGVKIDRKDVTVGSVRRHADALGSGRRRRPASSSRSRICAALPDTSWLRTAAAQPRSRKPSSCSSASPNRSADCRSFWY